MLSEYPIAIKVAAKWPEDTAADGEGCANFQPEGVMSCFQKRTEFEPKPRANGS